MKIEARLEELGFIPCECAHARELDTVLDAQVPDLVVHQGGHDPGALPEAVPQPTGDVVLAAALPDLEAPRGPDPTLTGVQPQHDLAEGDHVVAALRPGTDGQDAHAAVRIRGRVGVGGVG